jgi:endogenous inhibitor of DNA gyrase (YacG/DUF329 family)
MFEVVETHCPYCGEPVAVLIDVGGGRQQQYIEDCPVCCRPWEVQAEQDGTGEWDALLLTTDD